MPNIISTVLNIRHINLFGFIFSNSQRPKLQKACLPRCMASLSFEWIGRLITCETAGVVIYVLPLERQRYYTDGYI